MGDDDLTIVVPAWKATYLREALASIAAQTSQRFVCHVFDDAGDARIAAICADFPAFRYTRFDANLGGSSLVAQWNRCLAQVHSPWLWLFSDDDVMAPTCVQAFLAARQRQPDCAVFQFAVEMVSDDLQQVLWRSSPPEWESAADFLEARFAQRRLSCLPDHVFSGDALRKLLGGFVDLPLAWNADDATWALLGQQGGLAGVPEATVLWRQSGENISNARHHRRDKLRADIEYLQWLARHGLLEGAVTRRAGRWLGTRMVRLYGFGWSDLPGLWRCLPQRHRRALWWALLVRARDALPAREPMR